MEFTSKLHGRQILTSLFSSNFQHFNTFRPLFQKLLEINVKFKLQTCSACQDNAEHVCSLNLTFISNSF
jgi:hypothetical protein